MVTTFTSERCLLHDPGPAFPELPRRLSGILEHLRAADRRVEEVGAHAAARDAVLAVHDGSYVERFERAVARGDRLFDSADNPVGPGTDTATWAAVEIALAGADHVAAAPGAKAFCAVRPPGHHAEKARAMGFCFFDNVAVAAQYLLDHHGLERVAVFDFDVHHGNGTQHLFEERSDVFFASVHQFPFYPGTGAADERGRGAGEGYTLNVPLPAGRGDEGYEEAIRGRILPALADFRPQVLLVSAGFDAWQGDPLGGMRVSEGGFAAWGRWIAETAEEVSEGRVLALLEGGYDLAALPRLVDAHLGGLSGTSDGID